MNTQVNSKDFFTSELSQYLLSLTCDFITPLLKRLGSIYILLGSEFSYATFFGQRYADSCDIVQAKNILGNIQGFILILLSLP